MAVSSRCTRVTICQLDGNVVHVDAAYQAVLLDVTLHSVPRKLNVVRRCIGDGSTIFKPSSKFDAEVGPVRGRWDNVIDFCLPVAVHLKLVLLWSRRLITNTKVHELQVWI